MSITFQQEEQSYIFAFFYSIFALKIDSTPSPPSSPPPLANNERVSWVGKNKSRGEEKNNRPKATAKASG
jgi:hypothetical protein